MSASSLRIQTLEDKVAEQRAYIDLLVLAGKKADEEIVDLKMRVLKVLLLEADAMGADGGWAEEIAEVMCDKERYKEFVKLI
jgi:hypothetical protein